MRYFVRYGPILMIPLITTACTFGWKHTGGAVILSEVSLYRSPSSPGPPPDTEAKVQERAGTSSRRVSFALSGGWHWVMRGDDFIATRDGVFLQNISLERIHVDQVEHSDGMFPMAAFSSKQWPFRTVKYLKKRFASGMLPAEAADVVLASRANTPNVSEFDVIEVVTQTVAGHPGFKAVYDFKLNVQGRKTPYRTICYGFMLDDWFYGISYTAAKRHYFSKDAETLDSFLRSFRVVEK